MCVVCEGVFDVIRLGSLFAPFLPRDLLLVFLGLGALIFGLCRYLAGRRNLGRYIR